MADNNRHDGMVATPFTGTPSSGEGPLGEARTAVDRDVPQGTRDLVVVGIGASAGGLDALKQFFSALPSGSHLAFVVVMHLAPSRTSSLDRILSRVTAMNVSVAASGMRLEPDTIYVTPPGKGIALFDGKISLEGLNLADRRHHPIDSFFQSLAEERGECTIAVVLSGTGSDGAQGVRAIKDAGGSVIVQDEHSAEYPDMPRSAIATGVADLVLPVEAMPEQISQIAGNIAAPPFRPAELEEHLGRIFRLVKSGTGHDFSSYKESTVVRRIERRMAANSITDLADYVAYLGETPAEATTLCREMLIGVTSFFRDPDAFTFLHDTVFPRLFVDRDQDEPVRIWHAGCSTGEEVYSMAIAVQEYLEEQRLDARVQFFATDIDDQAIAHARTGVYPLTIGCELEPERLQRYFEKSDTGYRVAKPLREMIVFAQHSLVKDPPFSRLDLLVCRNFLIYLKADMQQQLISLFHLALKPGGVLFLGGSETVGRSTDLFAPLDKRWKVYERLRGERRVEPAFPFRFPMSRLVGVGSSSRPAPAEPTPGAIVEKLLMERYSPPCVVVNDRYEVIYVSTRPNRYLEVPVGEPSHDLLKMAREELRPILRSAIHKAFAELNQVVFRGHTCGFSNESEPVTIVVEPVGSLPSTRRLAMVIFEPGAPRPPLQPPANGGTEIPADELAKDQMIRQLEEQLVITHEQLQATIGQLETSNEGLMSTNEELLSINEEYQSTNEELHSTNEELETSREELQALNEELETSREELQALNEELITVNAELQQKVEELNQANSDMDNLLTSSEIATIFLDRQLNIKRFTPAMAGIFTLIPADIGRPFERLAGTIDWPGLNEDAAAILAGQNVIEREVKALRGDRCFLARVLPYRTAWREIQGIVITLVDITERKRMEARTEHLASFPRINPNPVIEVDLSGSVIYFNPAVTRILDSCGLDNGSASLFLPPDLDRLIKEWNRTIETTFTREAVIADKVYIVTVHLVPQFRVVRLYAYDITERRRAVMALRESEERYRGLFDNMLEGFAYCRMIFDNGVPSDFIYLSVNSAFEVLTGLKGVIGRKVTEVIPGIRQSDPQLFDIYARVSLTGVPERFERYVEALSMWFSISVYSPEREHFVAIFDVITERKQAEKELRESEQRLRLFIEHAPAALAMFDREMRYIYASRRWLADYRLDGRELRGLSHYDVFPEIGEAWKEAHRRGLAGEVVHSEGDRFERADGSAQWLQWEIRPWFDEAGSVGGIVIFTEDITDQKRDEEEREKNARLESLGILAGGIAHDFNNILTAVIGNISLARLRIGEEHPAHGQLATCEKALAKATGLTRQLLTFARGGEPVKDAVDTGQLLRDVATFSLSGSNCTLRFESAPGLWQMNADAPQVQQALNNLIINAVQAMPEGGTITLAADNELLGDGDGDDLPGGRYVKITLADVGCGIPAEILPRIFDPYFTTKPDGSGLGLASVYSIVKKHGGAIHVSSMPGKGTSFTLFIQAAGEKIAAPATRSGEPGLASAGPQGKAVLVMDDEEMIRALATDILTILGYRAVTCGNGAEAIALYAEHLERDERFSAVILDMTVPGGMGGKEAALRILELDPDAALIISSGYSVDTGYQGDGDPLFRGAVAKPYNVYQLAEELARVTANSRRQLGTGIC